jgi:hemerythrin superfamily protein
VEEIEAALSHYKADKAITERLQTDMAKIRREMDKVRDDHPDWFKTLDKEDTPKIEGDLPSLFA